MGEAHYLRINVCRSDVYTLEPKQLMEHLVGSHSVRAQ